MMIKKNDKLGFIAKEESDLYKVDYQGSLHFYMIG